jgi:tetratricopeptide (TPR) repeat protein
MILRLSSALCLILLAGTAEAGDPVRLLTDDRSNTATGADILKQAMPPAIVQAQQKPVIAESPVVDTASSATGPDKVDLAALYYYADQKQDSRVEAEIRRLKHQFPGFSVPKDLYLPQTARGTDEKALWALYNANDLIGVDAEIVRRAQSIPGWQPSDDFAQKFARKKMRTSIETAWKAKDWASVIASGKALDPAHEGEADLLWSLIDAYSATGDKQAMANVYRGILFRTPASTLPKTVVIATIQKATRDFPADDIRALVTKFSSDPAIAAGLTTVSADLVRKTVADFNADEGRKEPLAKNDIDALAAIAAKEARVADFSLLGWYDLKVGEPAEAGAWFRRALDKEQSAEHAKGLYLSLVRQQRQDEAYDLALKYRDALAADPVFLMNALAERFSKPDTGAIDAGAVSAYATTILAAKSGDHAEILAWYAYNSGQYEAARAWFSKAFGWKPAEARLKGWALAEAQLGDRNGLIALYQQYAKAYPAIWNDIHLSKGGKRKRIAARGKSTFIDEMKVGAVENEAPARRTMARPADAAADQPASGAYLKAFAAKNYGACIASLLQVEATNTLDSNASLVKGWCLLGLNRNAEAKAAFSASLSGNGKTRADAAYGLALTLLRGKLTDDAESVISIYPVGESRARELKLEIDWQKARSAFDHKQYQRTLDALNARLQLTPEPANLTQLRAWAHYNMGDVATAKAIFERLNLQFDDPALRRGLATTSGQTESSSR